MNENKIIPQAEELKTSWETREEQQIAKAVKRGYKDPRLDPDLAKSLKGTYLNGEPYRRFIEDFDLVPYNILHRNNVRFNELDTEYCKSVLVPKLLSAGKIENPIMTTPRTSLSEDINHGHGRVYSSKEAFGEDTLIPRFRLSKPKCLVDGQWVSPKQSDWAKGAQLISNIQCNGVPTNKPYSMIDVASQCRDIHKIDSSFGGIVDAAKLFPSREDFDRVMDALHPHQFEGQAQRTKIYNHWEKGNVASNIRHVGDVEIIAAASHEGWLMQIAGKAKKPVRFPEGYDSKNNAFVSTCTNKGNDFERGICVPWLKTYADGALKYDATKGVPSINLVVNLTHTAENLLTIQSAKLNFIANVKKWKTRLNTLKVPVGTFNLKFPYKLKDTSDKSPVVSV